MSRRGFVTRIQHERLQNLTFIYSQFYKGLVRRTYGKRGTEGVAGNADGRDTGMDADSEKITIRIPLRHLRAIDFLVEIDDYPSRSEAIRAAVRDLIYARLELVVDRMKKFEHAEQTLAAVRTYEEKYLKK